MFPSQDHRAYDLLNCTSWSARPHIEFTEILFDKDGALLKAEEGELEKETMQAWLTKVRLLRLCCCLRCSR